LFKWKPHPQPQDPSNSPERGEMGRGELYQGFEGFKRNNGKNGKERKNRKESIFVSSDDS